MKSESGHPLRVPHTLAPDVAWAGVWYALTIAMLAAALAPAGELATDRNAIVTVMILIGAGGTVLGALAYALRGARAVVAVGTLATVLGAADVSIYRGMRMHERWFDDFGINVVFGLIVGVACAVLVGFVVRFAHRTTHDIAERTGIATACWLALTGAAYLCIGRTDSPSGQWSWFLAGGLSALGSGLLLVGAAISAARRASWLDRVYAGRDATWSVLPRRDVDERAAMPISLERAAVVRLWASALVARRDEVSAESSFREPSARPRAYAVMPGEAAPAVLNAAIPARLALTLAACVGCIAVLAMVETRKTIDSRDRAAMDAQQWPHCTR